MHEIEAGYNSKYARQVIAVTALFFLVGAILAILISVAVTEMAVEATSIDDARATRAASAALKSIQGRLRATVRDNAVWDDAYSEMASSGATDWANENWGKTTQDYPLYDAAIVLAPEGRVVIAKNKGVQFEPVSYFGPALLQLVSQAKASGQSSVSTFVSASDGIYMVAAGSIQPFHTSEGAHEFNTLIFAKRLSNDVIKLIDEAFDIGGLALVAKPGDGFLSLPLTDISGSTISYVEWRSRQPGTEIYKSVRSYLLGAGSLLLTFLVGVLLAGVSATRALHQSAEQAHIKATHDFLSGLLNRAGLLDEAAKLLTTSPAVIYLIDLDGFKAVNDAWGHAVGDELIRQVAQRIVEHVPNDVLVSRLGGDEFAILASARSENFAPLLLQLLSQPFQIAGRTIEVGASIGVAGSEEDLIDPMELVRRADMALYRAKEAGKGRQVRYDLSLDAERQTNARMDEMLRKALSTGAVYPLFQPLINAKTGALKGVEALARWRAEAGPVSPEVFIPIAERAGLIDELGRTILSQAILGLENWPKLGLSVNVSPIQLRNPTFAAAVLEILERTQFDPARLTLEVTEGVMISNPDQAKRSIALLKAIGVKFALDDFGTGYASIGALREFGFDRMKIDRSLVAGLITENGAEVLNATISLATALNIPVTAEGVETLDQANALTRSGCDQLQGYLLGKPMTMDALAIDYFRHSVKAAFG